MNIFNLNNKKIYVVGGSGLVGKEVCVFLKLLGAKVFNLDIKNSLNFDKDIKFLKFNLVRENLIEKKLLFFFRNYGSPDCLINCSYPASSSWHKSDFRFVKKKTINENIKLHLNSYIWIARIFAEYMKIKKIKGSIIQFSSHYGVIGQNSKLYKGTKMRENMIYSAIKGGIISNVKQMCAHYGKYGIRVNSISPGGIQGHIKGRKIFQPKKFIKNYCQRTPLNRLANSKEISPAVAFLASDLSSYITGINLLIDGGWTAT